MYDYALYDTVYCALYSVCCVVSAVSGICRVESAGPRSKMSSEIKSECVHTTHGPCLQHP